MKRPSDEDGDGPSSPRTKLEAFFSGFLRRHPRLPVVLGTVLAVLIAIAALAAKISDKAH